MLPIFNISTNVENHAKAAYSSIAAFEEAFASSAKTEATNPEVEITLGSGIHELFKSIPCESAVIKPIIEDAAENSIFFAKVSTPSFMDFARNFEKIFSKKQAKKEKKAAKNRKHENETVESPTAEPAIVSIETPMAFQVVHDDGKLGPVMLSMPDGVIIPAPADYTDDCPVPITTVASTEAVVAEVTVADAAVVPEVTKAVEAAIEKVPAEEQKTNPMIAAMARANERRATQPQHSHAKAEVRRRKVAEPK